MGQTEQEFSLPPGSRAPETTFRDLDGSPVTLPGLLERAAGLPLLLAFFKVSCPTCRLTWPYLQKLHDRYGGKAVHVVGVSQNDAAASRAYSSEFGRATFDLVLDAEPAFGASNAYGVEAVPHLVLVSPESTVLSVSAGWSRKDMEELGRVLAGRKAIPPRPFFDAADSVKDYQAG
jgi:peroxiredoxin